MALLGQASGGWTESSSALRILYVGHRNSIGILTDDSFTRPTPPSPPRDRPPRTAWTPPFSASCPARWPSLAPIRAPTTLAAPATTPSSPLAVAVRPAPTAPAASRCYRPLGLFINDAAGNAFENQPGVASGKGPYVSSQGSYASSLYETNNISAGAIGGLASGAAWTYITGVPLITSLNGYLMPAHIWDGAAEQSTDVAAAALESAVINAGGSSTTIGILKMPADATQPELVFDQRI